MMEKRGIIDENTPQAPKAMPAGTKQAADAREDHPATRASDAVKAAALKPKTR